MPIQADPAKKAQVQQILMSLGILAAPLAKLTKTDFDDKIAKGLLKAATNDGALNLMVDLFELFANDSLSEDELTKGVEAMRAGPAAVPTSSK